MSLYYYCIVFIIIIYIFACCYGDGTVLVQCYPEEVPRQYNLRKT